MIGSKHGVVEPIVAVDEPRGLLFRYCIGEPLMELVDKGEIATLGGFELSKPARELLLYCMTEACADFLESDIGRIDGQSAGFIEWQGA